MSSKQTFVMFSDGGAGAGRGGAAAACIVETPDGERYPAAIYMGEGTNNEAEILAGVLGFALIRSFGVSGSIEVRWTADSEYTLKGATDYINTWKKNGWKTADKKPVKNQGLWRLLLEVSEGISIKPDHVRGHTGHTENEACDEAVQFAKSWGETQLLETGEGVCEEIPGTGMEWLLIDGQEIVAAARDDVAPDKLAAMLLAKLDADQASIPSAQAAPVKERVDPEIIKPVIEKLREAYKAAKSAAKKSKEFERVAEEIEQLAGRIKRF